MNQATTSVLMASSDTASRTEALKRSWLHRSDTWVVLAFFSLVVAACAVFVEGFFTISNATTIITTSSVVLIVSLGQALAIISGGFDLSVGGVVPLGAVTFAVLSGHGYGLPSALLAALAAGAAVGGVNAITIAKIRISPLIATLATLSVAGGVAYTVAHGLTVAVRAEVGALGDPAFSNLPYFFFLTIALVVAIHLILTYTIFGRRIYMVGGNAEAARLAGVRVAVVQGCVYLGSGVLAAFAGVVLASQLLAATGGVGSDTALTSVTAVVLGGASLSGGRGGIPGTVLGVLLLGTIADALNLLRVPTFYQQIVTGAVLLLAVGLSRMYEAVQART